MMAWVHDEIATHSPIFNINSAEPESGKTTTMGLISFLMPKCIASVEVSEAAMYRAIKRWQPSFCFDEFDTIFADDNKAALRSVINRGHTRGQGVLRCIGDDKVPEFFPTFAPKAIGMVGRKLPPATLSRCMFIELRRRRKDEHIEKFTHVDDAGLADLRRRLRRWAMDNEDILRNANPSMPDELQNRRADNWQLQLAIADLAGADWGDKARAAAVKIEGKADSRTTGARLLTDIKALFVAEPEAHCMFSATMVAGLTKIRRGHGLNSLVASHYRRPAWPGFWPPTGLSRGQYGRRGYPRPRASTRHSSRRLGPVMSKKSVTTSQPLRHRHKYRVSRRHNVFGCDASKRQFVLQPRAL